MAFPFAAAITAGGSLLSGLLGDSSAKKQNQQQVRAIEKANAQARSWDKKKVQTLVEDARKAGIHPMAALGSPVAGGFATPQAAYGGQPRSGSAIGDAMESFGQTLSATPSTSPLQDQLTKAQIANVHASTANLLSEATSRSQIANARLGGQSLSTGSMFDNMPSKVGAIKVHPYERGAAQRAQDNYGDIWEQLFGTANIGGVSVNPAELGPLSRNFYRYVLGNDWKSGTGK